MFRKRNPYAAHPLMRKGGVHAQSKTGQRTRDRSKLLDEAAECLDQYLNRDESENLEVEVKGERDAPFSFVVAKQPAQHTILMTTPTGNCNRPASP